MLSPDEFVAGWGKRDSRIRFREKALEGLALADEDKEFLVEAGLPRSAAPFLSFEAPKAGELPTVADLWKQPRKFRRYRVIGSDGSGNPIAIDEERAGEVVCLDHEQEFAPTLINKTVRQLAESLLAFRNTVRDSAAAEDGEIPAKVRKQLQRELKRIDPAAVKPGCFWPEATQITDADADYPAKVLRDLGSADASLRLKASKQLESELRNAATKQRKEQFGNKQATAPLIAALDDPDPKVVHNAVVSLAQISRHYFKDDRAYAKMRQLVQSQHPLTTRWAIDALIQLRGEASLDDILPLCTDPSQEARAMALCHLAGWLMGMRTADSGSIRPEIQDRLRGAALRALKDDDRTVRGNAATLLGKVGDASALAVLRKARDKESYWLTQSNISSAIEEIERRL